jgi:hypothetical protein
MPSIAYICGNAGYKPFLPTDTSVPGSETAVIQLSTAWSTEGWAVSVYSLGVTSFYKGVNWRNINNFDLNGDHDVIILWRQAGLNFLYDNPNIRAKFIGLDCHDGLFDTEAFCRNPLAGRINKIFVKSHYHRTLFKCISDEKRFAVILNGIQLDTFAGVGLQQIRRRGHRFCFTSQYDRGLEPILEFGWPIIKAGWPDAELHIYYGKFGPPDAEVRIRKLMNQPGVFDHGKVDISEIALEKNLSTYHYYISDAPNEIDCIAIRESLVAGCIPILSDKIVFKERDGLHISGPASARETHIDAAETVLALSFSQIALLRREGLKSSTIISWSNVAKKWLDNFTIF